jgi:hypothetical protein
VTTQSRLRTRWSLGGPNEYRPEGVGARYLGEALTEGMAETIALTEALGLDPQLFIEAIDDGPLGSPYAEAKARAALAGELDPPCDSRSRTSAWRSMPLASGTWSYKSQKRSRDAGGRRLPTAIPTRTSPQ